MVWVVVVLVRWWESGGEVIRPAWTREERIGRGRSSWLKIGVFGFWFGWNGVSLVQGHKTQVNTTVEQVREDAMVGVLHN